MYRILSLCALLVALTGCGRSPEPASESSQQSAGTTISLADVAGTWDGQVMPVGNDSVVTVTEIVATAEPGGWTLKAANARTPTEMRNIPVTSVVAAGDSVVVEAGPYESVLRQGEQVTVHMVYRMEGGRLVGSVLATYPENGQTLALRTVATRRAS